MPSIPKGDDHMSVHVLVDSGAVHDADHVPLLDRLTAVSADFYEAAASRVQPINAMRRLASIHAAGLDYLYLRGLISAEAAAAVELPAERYWSELQRAVVAA